MCCIKEPITFQYTHLKNYLINKIILIAFLSITVFSRKVEQIQRTLCTDISDLHLSLYTIPSDTYTLFHNSLYIRLFPTLKIHRVAKYVSIPECLRAEIYLLEDSTRLLKVFY